MPKSKSGVTSESSTEHDPPENRLNYRCHRERPLVEWIYPGEQSSLPVAERQNPRDPHNHQVADHVVDPSEIIVASPVIDGVVVPHKRCFIRIRGVTLCDDSFPCMINPKLFLILIAFILMMIVLLIIISIYTTGPSQNDSNDLLSTSVNLSPSQNPTNSASISPSKNPSMTPSYQCLVKYPYLNESLIGNGICDGGKYLNEECGHDGGDCIPALSLVGRTLGGGRKWTDSILGPNGYLYGIPYESENILKFNPSNKETSLVGKGLGGEKWFSGVLGSDDMIYGAPYNSQSILKYDPILDNISFIAEGNELFIGNQKFIGAVQSRIDNIYFIPYNHNKVLIFNRSHTEDPLVAIGNDLGLGAAKYRGGVLGQDGNIYGIPFNANRVMKISVSDGVVSLIGEHFGDKKKWSNGILAKNGNIYACPFSGSHVLKINTTDETTMLVGSANSIFGQEWSDFVEGPHGLLYGIPFNSDKLLIFDTQMEITTMIQLKFDKSDEFMKWSSGVLSNQGEIYAIPYHGSSNILSIVLNK